MIHSVSISLVPALAAQSPPFPVDNTGCTDPGAVNYDETATEDDGSCIFIPSLSVQDIQTTGFTGTVITSGIVTAVYGNNGALAGQPSYAIQNGTGANSGIWVIGSGVAVGDQVEVTGTVNEVFGLRQIQSAVPTIQSSGNALPAAEVLAPGAINDEQWECVLVKDRYSFWHHTQLRGVDLERWCGQGGCFLVTTPSTTAFSWTRERGLVEVGLNYRVTGPNFYSFGNWKVFHATRLT